MDCVYISVREDSDNYGANAGCTFTLLSETGDTVIWKIPETFRNNNSITNRYNLIKFYKQQDGYLFYHLGEVRLPILIMSYIDKIKSSYVGKKFISKKSMSRNDFVNYDKWISDKEMVNINNGEHIKIENEYVFTCVDLSLMNSDTEFKQPYLIFKDSLSNEFRVAFMEYAGSDYNFTKRLEIKDFYNENEYNNLLAIREQKRIKQLEQEKLENELYIKRKNEIIIKYGKSISDLILSGKVRIGFTKQMCIESWGMPEDINKTTGNYGTHEQWVYGNGNYLYFENGKLTAIQN